MPRKAKQKLSDEELRSRTEQKAKQIWEERGYIQGHDFEIWLEAEKLVKNGKA